MPKSSNIEDLKYTLSNKPYKYMHIDLIDDFKMFGHDDEIFLRGSSH
jgi:hypothetical protein